MYALITILTMIVKKTIIIDEEGWRVADYRKMYYALMDATERALEILEMKDAEAAFLCRKAAAELIQGEQACEEIYIETCE